MTQTNDPTTLKHALRRNIRSQREGMPTEERERRNKRICEKIQELLLSERPKVVAAYVPMPTEPGGDHLLHTLTTHCPRVFLPCSQPDRSLEWALYTEPECLSLGMYNIPEPTGVRYNHSILEEVDLMFVPAMAVDPAGFRLGKGAGYYDRALKHFSGRTVTVVYANEVLSSIPTEVHDIPTDTVITD